MRKIILSILGIIIGISLFSQTYLLRDDFEYVRQGWSIAHQGAGNDWGMYTSATYAHGGTGFAMYPYSATAAADAYLFFPALYLQSGYTYTVTFWQRVRSATYPERLSLTVGNDVTIASQALVQDYGSLTNITYIQRTATYAPATSGLYYFAFHCYSLANEWNLYIDDVTVTINTCINHNCTNATNIAALPYSASGLSNCGACVTYDNTDGCGSTFMDGSDYVFTYTPAANGWVDVELTTQTYGIENSSAVFLLDDCPSSGTANCLASSTVQYPFTHESPHVIYNMTAGQTYYIVVSNDPNLYQAAGCIYFDIDVTNITQPIPTDQDCYGAQPICNTGWTETLAYSDDGNYPSEINSGPSCLEGERNGAWYTFNVETSGTIQVLIDAIDNDDDFDFALYDITSGGCSGIFEGSSPEVSCNYEMSDVSNGGTGSTGINTVTALSNISFENDVNVTAGNLYMLYISQWSVNSGSGYVITLGGTADYVDNAGPELASVVQPDCGTNIVEIQFTENVTCSSLDVGDFTWSSPTAGQTITAVSSPICTAGGTYTTSVFLTLSSPINDPGLYTIGLNAGAITDVCTHVSPGGGSVNFTIVAPNPNITGDISVCPNEQNVVYSTTNNAGNTYSWIVTGGTIDGSGTNNSVTIDWGGTGTGTLTVTETITATGCSASDIQNVTINATPTATASNNGPVCVGTALNLTGGAGGMTSYSWSGPNAFSSSSQSPSVSGSATTAMAGTYTLTVTDANGCTNTASTVVTVNTLPTATASNNGPVCVGTALNLTGGPGGMSSYSWSGPNAFSSSSQSPSVSGSATTAMAGTYTITVTNANGCTSTASTVVTVNTLPTATASNNGPVCVGTALNLTGGAGGMTSYSWSGPNAFSSSSQSPSVSGSATTAMAGTYTITVTNANGCTSTASTVVTVNTLPTATASNNGPVCVGTALNLTGGAGGMTSYSWSGPNAFSSSSQSPNVSGSATTAMAGTYTITVTNANGCTSTASTVVTVNTLPTATASNNGPVCVGTALNLTGGAGGMTSYFWSGPNAFSSSSQSPSVSGSATTAMAGTYTITVTNANGCTSTANTVVTVNTLPAATATNNGPVCVGTTLNLTGGPGSMSSYSWSGPNSFSSSSQSPTVSGSATSAMAGSYTITVTNSNGCTNTASTTVVVNPLPSATATSNSPVCVGTSLNLTGGPGGMTSYSWSGPNSYSSSSQSPTVSASATTAMAGTYTITVTNANGCTNTASTAVTVNTLPTATAGNNGPVCVGTTLTLQGGANGMSSYSWSGPNSYSSSSQNPTVSASATTAMAGTYTITVTNANGCTATASTVVTVNTLPTATATSNSPVCVGTQLNLTGGPGSMSSYLWSGPNSFSSSSQSPTVSGSATTAMAGTYTITVTNANGCTGTASTSVTVNTLPTATATSNSPVCVGSALTLTGGPGSMSSYSWSGPNSYSSSSQSPTVSASATTAMAGTYTITVTNANGCTGTASANVTVNTLPVANAGADDDLCPGQTTVQLNASGGTGYAWSPAAGLSATNISNPVANPGATTTYTVTVTNANGCTATDAVVVTVNTLPTANAGADNSLCPGQTTVQLNASGGTGYAWSPATGLSATNISNPIANPAGTTTYTVTVTDANGCTASDAVLVTVNAIPNANAGADDDLCPGQTTVQLNASGGSTYAWSPAAGLSATNINNPVANPAATTTYTVTVTNASGCTDTDDVVVTVNTLPNANAGLDVTFCNGSSTVLNASGSTGTPTLTYVWDNGLGAGVSQTVNPSSTTTYTVTVTDGNGCTDTDNVTVNVNANPTANAGIDQTIPNGTSTTLNGGASGGSGGYSYSWNPAGSLVDPLNEDPTTVNLSSTTVFTVTVTDSNGCTGTDNMTVTITGGPLSAGATATPNTICLGQSVQLDGVGSGGSGSYTYSWTSVPVGFTSTAQNPVVSPVVTTTYYVDIFDGFNTESASVTVTVNPLPVGNAGADTPICNGSSITLNASGSTGTPALTYNWNNGLGAGVSHLVNPSSTTTYIVTVTDGNGCTDTDDIIITVNPLPVGNAGPDVAVCAGGSATIDASASTGTPVLSYSWNNGLGAGVSHTVTPASTTTYIVTVTDGNSCTDTDDITVTVNALPVADAGADVAICAGGSTTIDATASTGTPSLSFNWDNSLGAGVSHNVNPASTTTYTVTVTDGNSCTDTDMITVTVNALPVADAGADVAVCDGNSTTLDASASTGAPVMTYLWDNGLGTGVSHIITPVATTSYGLTVTDGNGCTDSDNIIVTVNSLPVANAGADVAVCDGDNTTVDASASTGNPTLSYSWDNGLGAGVSHTVTPLSTTTYTVTVTDGNSCTDTDDVTVTVNALPGANAGTDVTICDGQSTLLDASGSTGTPTLSYIWDNGLGAGESHTVNPSSTTTYTVTVTDGNSCTSTDDVTVTVNTLPTADAGADVTICDGDITVIDASASTGAPALAYDWDSGLGAGVSHPVNPSVTTTYTVTVTDGNGCTDTDDVIVTVNPTPIVDAGIDQTIPFGTSTTIDATVSGGTGSYTFSWTPVDSLITANIEDPTTINLSVTTQFTLLVTDDGTGCQSSDIVTITITGGPLFVFASASPDTICPADSVSLTALGSGGSGSYSFTWTSDPVGFSSLAQDTADFPVVTTTYYVEIFDGFNTNIDSVTVVVNPLPVADAGTDMMLCLGDTLSIDASASSGTPVLVFAWDNSLGAGVSHDVSPVLTTVYTVTVTDGNGCFSTDDVQITVLPLPVIDTVYVTDPLCFGDSTGTLIIETGNMDSLMHTIDNWASFQYDSLFTGLPAGTYDIVVEDTSGCQGLYQAVISEPTQLTVDTLYVTAASCGATGGTEVAASGGTSPYSYVWDSGDSTAVISNMPNGDYIVTVTDNNGCTAELTVNIPNAGGTGVVSITDTLMVSCYGLSDGSATAEMTGGTAPYSYEWSTTDTTAIVTGLAAGNYTVTVTDAFGCQGTTGITIIQPDSIYATFTEIPVSCYGDTDGEINLTVSGGESPYTYVWSTGDTLYTGLYGNLSPGGYEVTVVDGNGCKYVIIELTVGQPALLSVLASGFDPACDGDTTGNVTVAVSGGTIPYTFTWYHTGWTSSVSDQTIDDLGAGTYYVTVSDFMNCQGIDYVTLYDPPEMQVVVTDTINNYQGEITVTVIGGTLPVTYHWSNGETDNTLVGLGSGVYNLTVTDGNSCIYVDSVEIQIPLIVPSLFTPNVDGFNDTWEITNIDVYEDLSIEIYNRWGNIVFTFSGSGAEYATEPWDGTWNGHDVPMGGYVYVIDLKNDTEPYTGVVSVKR